MRLSVAAATHHGLARERNEDTVGVAGWVAGAVDTDVIDVTLPGDGPLLAVVADGMGGHPAGDVASKLAVEYLTSNRHRMTAPEEVSAVIKEANLAVFAYSSGHPEARGLGTTIAGLAISGSRALAFNVGDSSVLGVVDGYVRVLSHGDRAPRMPGQPAHAQTRAMSQCLGGTSLPANVTPHVCDVEVQPGDVFVLCTDGITDVIDLPASLREAVGGPADTVRGLMARVLELGAPDNLSLVVVHCG